MKRFFLMFGLVFVLSSFILAGCGRPPESKNAPPKRSYAKKSAPRPAPEPRAARSATFLK